MVVHCICNVKQGEYNTCFLSLHTLHIDEVCKSEVFFFFISKSHVCFSFSIDQKASHVVRQGSPGVEKDVLQAEPLLPTERAIQRHPALLHTLSHPLLEGRQCT